jgi:hypothetical protein
MKESLKVRAKNEFKRIEDIKNKDQIIDTNKRKLILKI